MTVEQLINDLKQYPPNRRVLLDSHGRRGYEEYDEILGSFKEIIINDSNGTIEEVVLLDDY